jgi:hypothetical protein
MRPGVPYPCSCDPAFTVSRPPAGKTTSPLCPICRAAATESARVASRLHQRQRRKLRKADLSDRPLPDTGTTGDPLQSKAWALGNLRGRAGGYRRGTLSLAGVTGAVRVAQSCDLSHPEIRAALDEHGLDWDSDAGRTIDRRTGLGEALPDGVSPRPEPFSDPQQAE